MQKIYENIQYDFMQHGIRTHLDKQDVYYMADIIRTELDYPDTEPINPFLLIDSYPDSLVLQYHNFDSCVLGGFLIKNDPRKFKSIITLNDTKPYESKKFNCTHELVHFFKDPDGEYACSQSLKNQKPFEWKANEGAAELLMPYRDCVPFIADEYENARKIYENNSRWGNLPFAYIPSRLARKYGVSDRIAEYRISNLEYEVHQYINGVDINCLEIISKTKQSQRGISFPSLMDNFRCGRAALDFFSDDIVNEYTEEYIVRNSELSEVSQINEKISCELYRRKSAVRSLNWDAEINDASYITNEELELLDRLKFGE